MIYLKWFFYAISEKILDLLNLFTAPIVVLFADKDGWLPGWLSWWQTPDNSLDGDIGWKTEHAPYRPPSNGWQRYINRVLWLYRNSMYGYANSVVGIEKTPHRLANWLVVTNFILPPGDIGKPTNYDRIGGPALKWKLYNENGAIVGFQFYWIWIWPNGERKIRLNLGWKLWDWNNPIWSACNCVFSFNPWKSI